LISNLFTFVTALGVALLLIPLFRLALIPLSRHGTMQLPHDVAARIGSIAVFLAVAMLLPMGGDGLAVRFADGRLALGLLLAAGMLVTGMTSEYRRLEPLQRLFLQGAFACTATLVGLRPSGVAPEFIACCTGVAILVVCSNAPRVLDDCDGLAAGCGAILAAFLALAAHRLGVLEWCDLNLGLCGALLALTGFSLSHGRFKVCLGDSGCLCLGFMLGLTLLRLSAAAVPGTRLALAFCLGVPLLETLYSLARRTTLRDIFRLDAHEHLHDRLCAAGLTPRQTLVLYWAATALTGLATLRGLHLIG
jgi:UDP-GlcNAc:undecaprenyl-phosphate GlcNAc-1-phosphate transferase